MHAAILTVGNEFVAGDRSDSDALAAARTWLEAVLDRLA
jgi:molybdopterin-biosynthesis enzyme MoeA-like protein